MKKCTYLFAFVILTASSLWAQDKEKVLLTINDDPVFAKEFKQVYQKNLDLVQEEEQKTVAGYLDLFIDYKLKVAEAYAQNLNNRPSYVDDFDKYEEQLARNYIYEDRVKETLIDEAYERSLYEIDASHILISCKLNAPAQDTLIAYNKIKKLRERALQGEDFTKLVVQNSNEPNAKESKGRLGYFTAFGMVYPFESMAYNTPEGKVSEIVRTSFGYHIIKIHEKRKKAPKISVSHIMVSSKSDAPGKAQERINEIYSLYQQGETFEDLAKQYSDDKSTGRNGGLMKDFIRGQLRSAPFEDAAYALENPGAVSKPVQSSFGWHIIKLNKIYPLETKEEKWSYLNRRVTEGRRAKIVVNAITDKIKDKYGFEKYEDMSFFNNLVTDDLEKKNWVYDTLSEAQNKAFFKIGDQKAYFNEFAEYISKRQKNIRFVNSKDEMLSIMYEEFETIKVKGYFKAKLELEDESYGAVIREYRNGLLIFEVMGDNVWDKAKNDTLGQQAYYAKNKKKYQWKQRVTVDIVSSSNELMAKRAAKLMTEGMTGDQIKEVLNTDEKVNVIVTSGTFELGNKNLPEQFEPKEGVSSIYTENNSFVVINVKELLAPTVKSYEEVKGRILSDYQTQVEAEWMESLRKKYKVKVNKKTLKKLKKELDS